MDSNIPSGFQMYLTLTRALIHPPQKKKKRTQTRTQTHTHAHLCFEYKILGVLCSEGQVPHLE